MSIAQISHFLHGIPKDGPQPKYYFMYEDHFSHDAFRQHFLTTKKATFGFLKDWTWHINSNHEPNIRFTFDEHRHRSQGPVVAPATAFTPDPAHNSGTFGFVFERTPDIEALIGKVYDYTKVTMVQDIHIWCGGGYKRQFVVKALVFWDPINTADGSRLNLLSDKVQREKWRRALLTLKAVGVPDMWINAMQRRLVGECVDPEPLFSDHPRRPKPQMQVLAKKIEHRGSGMGPPSRPSSMIQNRPTIQDQSKGRSTSPIAQGHSAAEIHRPSTTIPIPRTSPAIQSEHIRAPTPHILPTVQSLTSQPQPHIPPNAASASAIQDQLAQNVPLEVAFQRNAQYQSYLLFCQHGLQTPPLAPFYNVGEKRQADMSEDRAMEELKRQRRDVFVGGKLQQGRTDAMN